jgi:hypothetical protein
VVPSEIQELFLAPQGNLPAAATVLYRPALIGVASLHHAKASAGVDEWSQVALLAPLGAGNAGSPWPKATTLAAVPVLHDEPLPGARFAAIPAPALRAATHKRWSKMLTSHLYKEHALELWRSKDPKAISRPGESEGDFRARLRELRHEERDLGLEKLRKRYAPKLKRLQGRIRRAELKVDRESDQYKQRKMQTAISIGATVLGALFGRKLASAGGVGRATTAVRGASRATRDREDVARAESELEDLRDELAALEAESQEALDALRDAAEAEDFEYSALPIRPRKSDLAVERLGLVWTPWRLGADGVAEPA